MTDTAPDPVGLAARRAARFAHKLDFRLLAVSSPDVPKAERFEEAVRFFEQWSALCKYVALFEDVAPNAARKGRDAFARTQDHIEARQVA